MWCCALYDSPHSFLIFVFPFPILLRLSLPCRRVRVLSFVSTRSFIVWKTVYVAMSCASLVVLRMFYSVMLLAPS